MTDPQKTLLEEVRNAGILYVARNKRYSRTIQALEKQGRVVCVEPDYSRLEMDGWSLTDEGRNMLLSSQIHTEAVE